MAGVQDFKLNPLQLHPANGGLFPNGEKALGFAWAFYNIGDGDSCSTGDWKYDGSRVTEMIEMDYGAYLGNQGAPKVGNNLGAGGPLAAAQMLGYPVDGGGIIDRSGAGKLPMRHPVFYWLFASSISGAAHKGFVGYSDAQFGPVPVYARTIVTVTFTSLPYRVLRNDQINGKEYNRFTQKQSKNVARFISMPRQQFAYTAGQSNPQAAATINQSIGILIATATVTYTWYHVPETYLYGGSPGNPTNTNYAANVRKAEGLVNDAAFDGFPVGTLLCESTDIQTMEAPVDPVTLGLDTNSPPRVYKVTLQFKFFDPPYNPANPLGFGDFTLRGHNLEPDKDGYWYAVVQANGGTKYKSYSFPKIFQHAPADPNAGF
jgi:hypothetical protein